MKIQESGENYLEAILILKNEKGSVRSIDVAHYMDFSKPSISRAMGLLREQGCITIDREGWIELTESGRNIAETIYERHQVISNWLISLGVSADTAVQDACKIEHDISRESFEALKNYIQKES